MLLVPTNAAMMEVEQRFKILDYKDRVATLANKRKAKARLVLRRRLPAGRLDGRKFPAQPAAALPLCKGCADDATLNRSYCRPWPTSFWPSSSCPR